MALLLVAAMIALALPAQPAGAASPFYVKVEGRMLVPISETNQYVVSMAGGPAESGGNYSYTAQVSGELSSFDGKVVPSNAQGTTPIFALNVTAPSVAQEITLWINATSVKGTASATASTLIHITVVKPIVISANVVNQGNVTVTGVLVRFLADGAELHNTTITLASGTSQTVTYNWTAQGISNGEHLITVQLDPQAQFVRLSSGGTVFTQTIYVGDTGFGNMDMVMVILFILFLLLAYFIYKRPTKKRKKK